MKLWMIRQAFRTAWQRFKMPLARLHSYSWSTGDHQHICYAARLLEPDDFCSVCPAHNRKDFWIEHEDECDDCQYFGSIEFCTDVVSNKKALVLLANSCNK